MGSRTIPPGGSIPGRGRKPSKRLGDVLGGTDNLLGGLLGGAEELLSDILKGLGKTIGSIQNLNLDDLEKLVEARGDEEAKEKIKELKKILGEKGIGDLFSEGLNLSKLIESAAKHGGEFSQKFAGGKGIIRGGLRGHILGRPLGGKDLPLERGGSQQETKFDVKGTKAVVVPRKINIQEPEIDPIEEDKKSFIVRGYMAGVEEQDIVCEVKNNGTVLRIAATGRRRHEKEVELPSPVTQKVNWSYRNGILEVTLTKQKPQD